MIERGREVTRASCARTTAFEVELSKAPGGQDLGLHDVVRLIEGHVDDAEVGRVTVFALLLVGVEASMGVQLVAVVHLK